MRIFKRQQVSNLFERPIVRSEITPTRFGTFEVRRNGQYVGSYLTTAQAKRAADAR